MKQFLFWGTVTTHEAQNLLSSFLALSIHSTCRCCLYMKLSADIEPPSSGFPASGLGDVLQMACGSLAATKNLEQVGRVEQ